MMPNLLATCLFCGCFIVFVYVYLCCWGLMWISLYQFLSSIMYFALCLHVPVSFGCVSRRNAYTLVDPGLLCLYTPGPEVIKLFSCSTQLSMKFFLFINLTILTNFETSFMLNSAEQADNTCSVVMA